MRRSARWAAALLAIPAILIGAAVLAFVLVQPFRGAVQTAVLVPELLGAGPRLLSATQPEPERLVLAYDERGDRMDVYRPRGSSEDGGQHPAALLVLGVSPAPLDDPRVIRVGTALARFGLIVGIPSSQELIESRVAADEPARVVAAFRALLSQPGVDPDRTGILGFSVGGSLSLIAAADPRIADRVAYLNSFGAYADAATLLVDVATRTVVRDGAVEGWAPGDLTRRVFLGLLLDGVPAGPERDAIEAATGPLILGDGPTPESYDPAIAELLSGDAAAAYRLATSADRATAHAAVAALSPERRALLAAISPAGQLEGLRTPVFLMHDEADTAIPFAHLAPLAEAVPPDTLRRVTAFRLFDHVEVGEGIGLEAAPELMKLLGHVSEVLGLAL
jgi:pimeloyl-ACP methyl ester carboxylesterase